MMCFKVARGFLFISFFYFFTLLLLSVNVVAQQPHFDNDSLIQQPTPPDKQPAIGQLESARSSSEAAQQVNQELLSRLYQKRKKYSSPLTAEEELLANPELTELLINSNIMSQNWDVLSQLLFVYAQIEGHDPLLLSYGKGALYRHQGQHGSAIREYRNILATKPDLIYVRFDLAAMLFENKEYTAAKDQFHKIKADDDLPQELYLIIDQYLEAIQKQEGWDWNIGLEYTHNDNVNNASAIEEIQIGPFIFLKDEESLPQAANGVGYQFGVRRNFQLEGPHYVALNAQFYGVDYWDKKDYSEQTLRLGTGYKFQDFKSEFSLMPFVERTWLGQKEYALNFGAGLEGRYWLNNKNQLIGAYHYIEKTYDNSDLEGYEGNLQHISFLLVHFYSPTLIFTGGVEAQWDTLNADDESSQKYGLQAGVIKEWSNSLSTRLNFKVSERKFNEEHFIMPETRKDHEYQVDFSFWHRKIHWQGVTPKLNYRYLKIDSNIPALYSRESRQMFLSFEKTF